MLSVGEVGCCGDGSMRIDYFAAVTIPVFYAMSDDCHSRDGGELKSRWMHVFTGWLVIDPCESPLMADQGISQ